MKKRLSRPANLLGNFERFSPYGYFTPSQREYGDQRSRLFPGFEGLPKNMTSPKERIATAVMSIDSIIDPDFNHTRAFKSTGVLRAI